MWVDRYTVRHEAIDLRPLFFVTERKPDELNFDVAHYFRLVYFSVLTSRTSSGAVFGAVLDCTHTF